MKHSNSNSYSYSYSSSHTHFPSFPLTYFSKSQNSFESTDKSLQLLHAMLMGDFQENFILIAYIYVTLLLHKYWTVHNLSTSPLTLKYLSTETNPNLPLTLTLNKPHVSLWPVHTVNRQFMQECRFQNKASRFVQTILFYPLSLASCSLFLPLMFTIAVSFQCRAGSFKQFKTLWLDFQ